MSPQKLWTTKLTDIVDIKTEVTHQVKYIIWFNPLNSSSLRLSKEGYYYFANRANFVFYNHNLKNKLSPLNLVQMERHMKCPYYINNLTKVSLIEQSISMVLSLYDNDLQRFLIDSDALT